MKRKIKVCWYCEKWQPGGIQAVQVNLLKHMDLSTLDFHIVVSEDDTDLFDQQLSQLGVTKTVTLNKVYSSPGKRVLANIFAFKNYIKKGKFDVVHFNACHGVELIYLFWAWLYRVPIRIIHCRNNDIGAGGRSRKIKIACHEICKVLFKNCANIKLANSDLAAIWLFGEKQYKHKQIQILRNGIDARRYEFDKQIRNNMRNSYGLNGKFVVGHIGHFNYQKNHEFLLNVFAEILKRNPEAVLLLVGEGDREKEIYALACKLKLEKNIIFYGVTNDVASVLCMMDVFVFPSRFEGFGNVLLEAQASGLDCFASQDVIPKAVKVTENLHWISLDSSYEAWATQILSREHNHSRNNYVQKIVDAGFDISNMAAHLEKIYHMPS